MKQSKQTKQNKTFFSTVGPALQLNCSGSLGQCIFMPLVSVWQCWPVVLWLFSDTSSWLDGDGAFSAKTWKVTMDPRIRGAERWSRSWLAVWTWVTWSRGHLLDFSTVVQCFPPLTFVCAIIPACPWCIDQPTTSPRLQSPQRFEFLQGNGLMLAQHLHASSQRFTSCGRLLVSSAMHTLVCKSHHTVVFWEGLPKKCLRVVSTDAICYCFCFLRQGLTM